MPKLACMTRQTLLMFPQMASLNHNSLNFESSPCYKAAKEIALGVEVTTEGFSFLGRGAYTKAFSNEQFVVKGDQVGLDDDNSAAWNYRTWFRNTYKARHTSKLFVKACKKHLAPTVVLFDSVVVQEKVKWLGNTFSPELNRAVWELAIVLGITDMHGANWGVTENFQVRMFDIMPNRRFPKGEAFMEEEMLQNVMAKVERRLEREIVRLQLRNN